MKFLLLLCGLLLLPGVGQAQVPQGKPCAEPVTDSLRFQGARGSGKFVCRLGMIGALNCHHKHTVGF